MADAAAAAELAAAARLPLRDRAKHKNWRARVAAFEDIIAWSTAGSSADDEAGPSLWKRERRRLSSASFALRLPFSWTERKIRTVSARWE